MTEHDKLALLYMINKTSEVSQHVIAAEDKIDNNDTIEYFKIKLGLKELIKEFTEEAEAKECEVVWKDNQAIKIVEKEEKELCEDYIKREDVIQHICESRECYKADCKGRLYKRCWDLEWVYDLPSIKVKPTRKIEKKGKYDGK